MNRLTTEQFEALVREAILELPENIRAKMDNVAVVIEDAPTPEQFRKNGTRQGDMLLGLYEGVPRTRRGPGYTLALPDKITIFKGAIEMLATSPRAPENSERVKEIVRETVRHEIAHHFGFDEPGAQRVARRRKS